MLSGKDIWTEDFLADDVLFLHEGLGSRKGAVASPTMDELAYLTHVIKLLPRFGGTAGG